MLYIAEKGNTVQSIDDLRGRTIYSAGKGATPEYALEYVLSANGLEVGKDVFIEWKSEHAECVAALKSDTNGVAMLPQPFAATAVLSDSSIRIALDLNQLWQDATGLGLITGVTIVNRDFAAEHPDAIKAFLSDYSDSVSFVTSDSRAASVVASLGIVPEKAAEAAIPYCNIVMIDGEEMHEALSFYLSVLETQNPQAAIVFWIAIWWIASIMIGEDLFLPSPFSVAERLVLLVQESQFWMSAAFTLSRILIGFILSLAVALATAWLSSSFVWFRILMDPLVRIVRATPVASIVILALVWVSSRNLSALISALMVFPIVYTNVLKGIDETPRELIEMADAYHIRLMKRLRYIYIPSVLPYFLSSLSIALGLAWKSGIAAEVIGLPDGSIGERVYEAKIYLSTPDLFAWTVTIVILAFLFERLFLLLSSKLAGRLMR